MPRKMLVFVLVASLALAGCIGGSDNSAPTSGDGSTTDGPGDATGRNGTDDTAGDETGNVSETERRMLLEESFSVIGPQASTSFDLTVPNGTTNATLAAVTDTQASVGFSISVFEDCSDEAGIAVAARPPAGPQLRVPYSAECGTPEPGDHTLTISHFTGVSRGTVNVTATVPVDA